MTTLNDGREVTPDLNLLTVREVRSVFDKAQPQEEEDTLIAKCYGLTLDDYLNQPYPVFRQLVTAFIEAIRNPVKVDENSKN